MMSQFIFGLFAGIVVGLVMEWVIDWAGLLPKGMTIRRAPQAQGAAKLSARADKDEQIAEKATISSSSSQSKSGE
jgi:hypothetical protein